MRYENLPAFPFTWQNREGETCAEVGLTKREYLAAKAMQGLCARGQGWDNMNQLARKAVEKREELEKELETIK